MVDEDTRVLDFVAFDQHYVVELTRKTNWAPSTVRHTNVDEDVHSPVSSVENSCHYSGRVLNYEDSSVVSASLCAGRGIRARISAFGETLIMKPSAYYLDLEADKAGNHSLDGEVLVYRLSDFDKPVTMINDELTEENALSSSSSSMLAAENEDDEQLRRRLYNSWSPAKTEIAAVIGMYDKLDLWMWVYNLYDFIYFRSCSNGQLPTRLWCELVQGTVPRYSRYF